MDWLPKDDGGMTESTPSFPSPIKKQNDTLQILFLLAVIIFILSVLFFTTALRPAALLTLLNILLLSPIIHFLQTKKVPKTPAILIVFFLSGILLAFGLTYATRIISSQWDMLSASLPQFGELILQKMNLIEAWIKDQLSLDLNLGITQFVKKFGSNTQAWLLTNFPSLLGEFASAAFLVPIFSFFILRDGEKMKQNLFKLVPDRYFDSTVHVITKTTTALSEFLRAKLIEAFVVGFLTFVGLMIVGSPYAGVFALVAGVTNIIPYLGPIMGVIPPLAVIGLSESLSHQFWPVLIVYIIVNAIDLTIIFPVFVAKLVNLSPLVLLAAVAVGQELYGLVGMLLAVPLASILKIIFQELVHAIYGTE